MSLLRPESDRRKSLRDPTISDQRITMPAEDDDESCSHQHAVVDERMKGFGAVLTAVQGEARAYSVTLWTAAVSK